MKKSGIPLSFGRGARGEVLKKPENIYCTALVALAMKAKFVFFLIVALAAFSLGGCQSESGQPDDKNRPLKLVCTTGMIGDAIKTIAGPEAEVVTLMGPGVDPHLYKATQGDLRQLSTADAIFYNGLHLEGKMGEVLEKVARQKPVIAVAEGLPEERLINSSDYASAYDPHIWFDVARWRAAVSYAGEELVALDTTHAPAYRKRLRVYLRQLDSLDRWVRTEVRKIPEPQRVLITAHDAFTYFGEAYEIEVRGLQGISTVSEYGLRDISELVNFITERQIKAVFVESSVPRKSLEAVVEGCARRGHQVEIGGTLYSDAMGAAGTPEGNYPGMVRANVNTIVKALR